MPLPIFPRLRLAACTFGAATLVACSPTFNWREVPVGDDGLVALLPCKPERATRELPLGADAVAVDMAGCQAGGATFAVAHASARDAAQAESWLRAWRSATRSQLEGLPVVETAPKLPRAAALPAPARLDSEGAKAGAGEGSQAAGPAHVLWFAQQREGRVSLYQATVLGQPSSSEAVSTFFEGLRIP